MMLQTMTLQKVTLIFCLLMIFAGCSAEEIMADPSISIEVDSEQLEEGKVILHSTFDNQGPRSVTFLPWGTPFESMLTSPFLIINTQIADDLLPVPYEGIMIKRAPPQDKDYITVDSGQTHSNSLDITKSYSFCRGLPYMITYMGPLLTLDNTKIKITTATAKFITGDSFPLCAPTE